MNIVFWTDCVGADGCRAQTGQVVSVGSDAWPEHRALRHVAKGFADKTTRKPTASHIPASADALQLKAEAEAKAAELARIEAEQLKVEADARAAEEAEAARLEAERLKAEDEATKVAG